MIVTPTHETSTLEFRGAETLTQQSSPNGIVRAEESQPECKSGMIAAWSIKKGWHEVEDPVVCPEGMDWDRALSKAGYCGQWTFPERELDGAPHVRIFGSGAHESFLAEINGWCNWYPIFVPSLPDVMEFIRLYVPAFATLGNDR